MDDNLNEPVGKANYEDDRHEIADPSKEKEGESNQQQKIITLENN